MFSFHRNGYKLIKLGMVIMNDTKKNSAHSKLLHSIQIRQKDDLLKLCFKRKHSTATNIDPENELNFDDITKGDKEVEHKLKVILLETEVMRQEGKSVPEKTFFTAEHWKELLNLSSRSARRKYLEYLFRLSKTKENRKIKRFEKKLKREEFINSKEVEKNESLEEFALKYDLAHNNMFLRFYDSTINQMYNNRLFQAMMFGQKLVVDCGYDKNMTKRENINCAKQLMLLFGENRIHEDPFDLHFCNTDPGGELIKYLHKHIPNMYELSFPLNLHESSYLDLFPKDQLVYLTPHCRQEMTEFDFDAIYIIGAIVDKINIEPLSLAKAKKEGLKMAKLPLDRYLQWGAGSGKSLTLNQVTSILNDIKLKRDWDFALRHVPKRKVVDYGTGSSINKTGSQKFGTCRPERRWKPSSNVDLNQQIFTKNKQ
ncbi:mitochondrial ribonuclease P protein 1 homolog [Anoplophora glabripennis]|uniref:mitochondrial ribonuclease P protein 1 homolog n=1 Tax=Anoplophora glabripennis TaxID=217634 RepID=UPI000874C2BD|nr:mitochondrial ribonuclease P protein 1 homolog [Anoplophora glabripennis]